MHLKRIICLCWLGAQLFAACLPNTITNMRADGAAADGLGTGVGEDGAQGGPTAVSATPDHLPNLSACVVPHTPKARGIRRLTGAEVTRTLSDIFMATDVPDGREAFGGDSTVYAFDGIQSVLNVSKGSVVALQIYGEAVGSYAASHLSAVSSCSSMDATCRRTFIAQMGKKMARRPLSDGEAAGFDTLMASASSFAEGVKVVVSAMVQAPLFVYRTELGSPSDQTPGQFVLGAYEVASSLSYLLTGSAPDEALMAAADNNKLLDPNERMSHARRLLSTPQGKAMSSTFTLQWLQVDALGSMARTEGSLTLTSELKAALREEVRLGVEALLAKNTSTLHDVFTTPTSFINAELATFYGVSSMAPTGSAYMAVPMASIGRDAGVLGMGAVIAAASQTNIASPTLRGRMVRMRMLCGSIPAPPSSIPPIAANAKTDGTIRHIYKQHADNPACTTCHVRMDPLGYPFGHYDTIGRRRPGDTENGLAIDTSGQVTDAGSADVPLSGLADLTAFLAQSDRAGACFARHWSMYAYGATSWPQDACTFDDVAAVARASGYNLSETFLGLIGLPSFISRTSDA